MGKNFNFFRLKVLEILMFDPGEHHDVYSQIHTYFNDKDFDKYVKAMKIQKFIQLSKRKKSAGSLFPQIKITKDGIHEYTQLSKNDALINNQKINFSFSYINILLRRIPIILKNTYVAIIAIITFIIGIGTIINYENFGASLINQNTTTQVQEMIDTLNKLDINKKYSKDKELLEKLTELKEIDKESYYDLLENIIKDEKEKTKKMKQMIIIKVMSLILTHKFKYVVFCQANFYIWLIAMLKSTISE